MVKNNSIRTYYRIEFFSSNFIPKPQQNPCLLNTNLVPSGKNKVTLRTRELQEDNNVALKTKFDHFLPNLFYNDPLTE